MSGTLGTIILLIAIILLVVILLVGKKTAKEYEGELNLLKEKRVYREKKQNWLSKKLSKLLKRA